MNTGKIIETSRLYLIPGKNSRDDEAFIKMLIILKEKVTVNVSIPYIERTKKIL